MKGLVIKNTGSWYLVKTEDGRCVECKIKGNFRLKGIRSTNPVAVGDYVQIILNQEGTAFISEIEDRKNYIIRRASNLSKQSHIIAANLDQCMLIVTVNYPETSTTFIDRFLASAEAYRIPVKLIFNKIDAYDEDDLHYLDSLVHLYTTIGYSCFKVSATQGTGIDLLKAELSGRVTLLSGNSGVGKSTLLNAILPEAAARTGEISTAHNKGMHTTTFSEMFPPRRRRLPHRHAGYQGLRHLRHGGRRDRPLFSRNIQSLGRLPLRQLYPPPRAWLCRTPRCRGTLHQRVALPVVPQHARGQGRRQVSDRLLRNAVQRRSVLLSHTPDPAFMLTKHNPYFLH